MKLIITLGFDEPEVFTVEDSGENQACVVKAISARHPGLLGITFTELSRQSGHYSVSVPLTVPQSQSAHLDSALSTLENFILRPGASCSVVLPDGRTGLITVKPAPADTDSEHTNVKENEDAELYTAITPATEYGSLRRHL